MQVKTFKIVVGDTEAENQLNAFLRGHRVLSLRHHFVAQEGEAYWVAWVQYVPSKKSDSRPNRSDGEDPYRESLSEADYAVYARICDWRREEARDQDVPAYAILTNRMVAALAVERPKSKAALAKIKGVGEGRAGLSGLRWAVYLIGLAELKAGVVGRRRRQAARTPWSARACSRHWGAEN